MFLSTSLYPEKKMIHLLPFPQRWTTYNHLCLRAYNEGQVKNIYQNSRLQQNCEATLHCWWRLQHSMLKYQVFWSKSVSRRLWTGKSPCRKYSFLLWSTSNFSVEFCTRSKKCQAIFSLHSLYGCRFSSLTVIWSTVLINLSAPRFW